MSALFERAVAIAAETPAEDHTQKKGCVVKFAADKVALITGDSDLPYGVILDGEDIGGTDSIAIFGGNCGPVRVKAGGTCTKGSFGMATGVGSGVKDDTGSGSRYIVCRFLESGVLGELVTAVLVSPDPRS